MKFSNSRKINNFVHYSSLKMWVFVNFTPKKKKKILLRKCCSENSKKMFRKCWKILNLTTFSPTSWWFSSNLCLENMDQCNLFNTLTSFDHANSMIESFYCLYLTKNTYEIVLLLIHFIWKTLNFQNLNYKNEDS